jgi:thiamine biosynthesis lipoprotein
MPISLHLRGVGAAGDAASTAAAAVFDELRTVDATFSTFRPDSDISRLNRGELALAGCHPAVVEVVDLCAEAHRRTGGAFDARLPGPGGRSWFDPSGLVKGWAVERAAAHLEALGRRDGVAHCLNAGGDVTVGVTAAAPDPWRVGIEDPDGVRSILGTVVLSSGGIATSGSAHRGEHIVDPRTAGPAISVRAATVTGPSLLWADVYATAVVVTGPEALDWIAGLPGYEALVVLPSGEALMTPAFPLPG